MATYEENTKKEPVLKNCAECGVEYDSRSGGLNEKFEFICIDCYHHTKPMPTFKSCTKTLEDKNGHKVDEEGNLVFDERCRGCDAPKPMPNSYKKDEEVVRDFEETFLAIGLGHIEGNKIVKKDYQPMTIENVKSFLLQTRHDDRETLLGEIEEMKQPADKHSPESAPAYWARQGYNAALSDLLSFIRSRK